MSVCVLFLLSNRIIVYFTWVTLKVLDIDYNSTFNTVETFIFVRFDIFQSKNCVFESHENVCLHTVGTSSMVFKVWNFEFYRLYVLCKCVVFMFVVDRIVFLPVRKSN